MRNVCDVLYAVLYFCVICFVVCGCAVSRRYIDVCNCDVFSVVNVYHGHLKLCVVCINGCCCLTRPGPSSSQSMFLLSR